MAVYKQKKNGHSISHYIEISQRYLGPTTTASVTLHACTHRNISVVRRVDVKCVRLAYRMLFTELMCIIFFPLCVICHLEGL